MADGRPIKQVKFQKHQKAHLHPLRDVCVKHEEIHARVTEFCSGNEMRTSGRGTDGRPDIRGDANTPRPHFVGRGIKTPKGTSTPPKGCVSKIKEIHARVTEFCYGNEMRTSGRGTDVRRDGHPRRRQYLPPPLRRAGEKNASSLNCKITS